MTEQPQKSFSRTAPESAAEASLESLAAEYDRAILEYENHYAQQQACSRGYGPYAGKLTYPQETCRSGFHSGYYLNDPYGNHSRANEDYGRNLLALEQSVADFHAALPQLRRMKGAQREKYAGDWKEYLQNINAMNKELIVMLEETIGKINERLA